MCVSSVIFVTMRCGPAFSIDPNFLAVCGTGEIIVHGG